MCGREGVLDVVCTFTSSGVRRKKLNLVISLSFLPVLVLEVFKVVFKVKMSCRSRSVVVSC